MSNTEKVKEWALEHLDLFLKQRRDFIDEADYNQIPYHMGRVGLKKRDEEFIDGLLGHSLLFVKAENQRCPNKYDKERGFEAYENGQKDMIKDGFIKAEKE